MTTYTIKQLKEKAKEWGETFPDLEKIPIWKIERNSFYVYGVNDFINFLSFLEEGEKKDENT